MGRFARWRENRAQKHFSLLWHRLEVVNDSLKWTQKELKRTDFTPKESSWFVNHYIALEREHDKLNRKIKKQLMK